MFAFLSRDAKLQTWISSPNRLVRNAGINRDASSRGKARTIKTRQMRIRNLSRKDRSALLLKSEWILFRIEMDIFKPFERGI
jgi:hypothetical protein